METLDLLRRLSEASGVLGYELHARDLVAEEFRKYADETPIDKLESVIARKADRGALKALGSPVIAAHLDEISLTITAQEGCFLRFSTIGGFDRCPGNPEGDRFRTRANGFLELAVKSVGSPQDTNAPITGETRGATARAVVGPVARERRNKQRRVNQVMWMTTRLTGGRPALTRPGYIDIMSQTCRSRRAGSGEVVLRRELSVKWQG